VRRAKLSAGALALLAFAVAGLLYAGILDTSYLRNQARYLRIQARKVADIYLPSALRKEREKGLKPGDSFKECASCPEMKIVPAGEFMMGSDEVKDARPVHKVRFLEPFAVGRFSVTFDEWDGCLAHGGCTHNPNDESWGRGKRPVINVSWKDAQQYVAWLSKQTGKTYRLLTEAEWEYAARAGSTTRYPWGEEIGEGNANCDGCGSSYDNKQTAPVGSFKANGFGLFDMHGNVRQWVEDCYHESYQGAPADGSAWTTQCKEDDIRVLRGASWGSDPDILRSALRGRYYSDLRVDRTGFRVGRSLAAQSSP